MAQYEKSANWVQLPVKFMTFTFKQKEKCKLILSPPAMS